jgi:bifunctional ADP-heptose synthase (sugar kinase/adenylyltransferase)
MTTLLPPSFESKVCSPEQLATRLASLPRPLVFTNGVFDILHRGHASYLAQARALGASLVVGQALLVALESVDMAILFTEQTPVNLIEKIRPDIYVKGGDYEIDTLPETKAVKSWGGKAVAIPFIYERSTTSLLGKIRS